MKKIIPILALLAFSMMARGQSYTFQQYMQLVQDSNISLAAERLNIAVAQSESRAARAIQDPSLSVGYDNNSDWSIAMGQAFSAELSMPISFGKIAARSRVARHEQQAVEASFRDYALNLQADAALAYLDALLARDLAAIGQEAYQLLANLYHSDSVRCAKGEIAQVDALQTHLEMVMAQQEWQGLVADYQSSLIALDQWAGQPRRGTRQLQGTLKIPTQMFDPQSLADAAASNRADVAASLSECEAAQSQVSLVRRERLPEVELSAGVSYNSRVLNEEAPAPEFVGYSASLGIPLPVSLINRGEVRASQFRAQQAQLQVRSLQAEVYVQVLQAFTAYQSSLQRATAYSTQLLDQAYQILEGKIYAYRRGETSLLDLLAAQHTHNQVQQEYAASLHACLTAYIELLRASGLDINCDM